MATTHENTPATPVKPAFNIVTVYGKVDLVERYKNEYHTILICPSVDEFSNTQAVKVRSHTRLGSKNDLVTCTGRLGGWKRPAFQTKPNKDGEVSIIVPVEMTIDVIE